MATSALSRLPVHYFLSDWMLAALIPGVAAAPGLNSLHV